jgi:hypothetical protein
MVQGARGGSGGFQPPHCNRPWSASQTCGAVVLCSVPLYEPSDNFVDSSTNRFETDVGKNEAHYGCGEGSVPSTDTGVDGNVD